MEDFDYEKLKRILHESLGRRLNAMVILQDEISELKDIIEHIERLMNDVE